MTNALDFRAHVSRAIFGIIVTGSGDYWWSGTGFAIARDGNRIIGVTAAHILDDARHKYRQEKTRSSRLDHLFDGQSCDISETLNDVHLVACFSDSSNQESSYLEIISCSLHPNCDIATIVLEPSKWATPAANINKISCIGLDFRAPMIGREVALVGAHFNEEPLRSSDRNNPSSIAIDMAIGVRSGLVESIFWTRDDDGSRTPAPGLRTTIKISGGMSGSPIFQPQTFSLYNPGPGIPIALALASVDDPQSPGKSSVALLGPLLEIIADERGTKTIRDMINAGKITSFPGILDTNGGVHAE